MQLPEDYAEFNAADRVDLVCDAFEESYRRGGSPRIEEFLSTSLPVDRETLLSELVLLDVDYRRRRGDPPTVDEYIARFPDDLAMLNRQIAEDLESPNELIRSTVVQFDAAVVDEPPATEPRPVRELGRYRLEAIVGRGAYGEVWRARDPVLDRDVALKTLRSDRRYSRDTFARFLEEGRKLARLRHPGIVRVHDVGHEQSRCFIVSEFIAGETLADRLERDGKLPLADALSIAVEVADALHAAHLEGIVHRDVKPSNILLDERGRPHLTDFGLAITEDEQLHEPSATVGTYAFMSPEQVRGDSRHVDARTDLYCLGIVLYRMLTGRLPFQGNTEEQWRELILHREPRPLRTIDESIPPLVEQACLKCLSKPMADRYTTAGDLAAALRGCLPLSLSPTCSDTDSRRFRRRRLSRVIAAGVVFIAAAIAIGVYQRFPRRQSAAESLGSGPAGGGDGTLVSPEQGANGPTAIVGRARPVVLNAHPGGAVFRVHFSEDGQHIVSCGSDGFVRVWDVASKQRVAQMQHLRGPNGQDVIDVALLPDSTLAVTACYNGLSVVWDWRAGRNVRQFERHRNQVEGVAWITGTRVITTGWHDAIYVWDAATGEVLKEMDNSHSGGVRAAAVHADGRRAVTGDYNGNLLLWDLSPGSERLVESLEPISETNSVWSIDWVPGGDQIAIGGMCASGEPLLLVFDTVTHEVVRRYSQLTGRVYGVCVSRDGERMYSAADHVFGWSLSEASDEPLFEFAEHRDNAFAVAESPDGTLLATGGTDGTIRIFPWKELAPAPGGTDAESGRTGSN